MNNLSIIIPVQFDDDNWQDLVTELLTLPGDFEIIVIGPQFQDIQSDHPKICYKYSLGNRATKQNIAAQVATKANVWFLYPDSKLSSRPLQKIEEKLKENPSAIFFFDLNFLPDGPILMIFNSLGAYWRSHVLKMPLGDQGFFMARKTFFSLGFFDEDVKYGEDHLLIWKAHQRKVPVLSAQAELFTSAHLYKNVGWITTTVRNLVLTYKQAFPQLLIYLRERKKKKFTTAIAIFVKTPGISPLKTRLAATIGKELAEEFFSLSIKATEAIVLEAIKKSEGKIEAYWAVAEKECLQNPLWNSFQTIPQGSGKLGDRLSTIYTKLQKKHKRVFLIGADLPQLDYKILLKAHYKLNLVNNFILGETIDGGFYLFGGRQIIERSVWNSVPYRTESSSSELINQLGEKKIIFIEKNFGIDFVEDLIKLTAVSTEGLLPEQVAVIEWARNLNFVID
jgi:glycosyltransferase A (GT-A) superfamily protein (DUF2064 family)